jgi:hypothetical protein
VVSLGASKQDLAHRLSNFKKKLVELEKEALNDPLKRNRKLHEEIAELKKKLAEYA